MWTPIIGENAGKLWTVIKKAGEINLAGLKKQSKLDDRQLYLTLGWLAREDKVKFTQDKNKIMVALR